MEVRVHAAVLEAVTTAALAARPAECCGMLVGSGNLVLRSVPARNLATDHRRFLIDPRDHIDARRAARRERLEIVGFYHSHPGGAADPSARDKAEASYDDCFHLILGLPHGAVDARLFKSFKGNFLEVPFVTVP